MSEDHIHIVELDIALAQPLEGGTNRNRIVVSREGAMVYKPENEQEVANYRIVERHRRELLDSGVAFPILLRRALASTEGIPYAALIAMPHFTSYNVREHFGAFPLTDTNTAFDQCVRALDAIGKVIPISDIPVDKREDEESLPSTLGMLDRFENLIANDVAVVAAYNDIKDAVVRSQPYIEELPRVVQHKDANPSNFRMVTVNTDTFVNFIDLETLGLARRGWDEGRIYSLLALDPRKQEQFLNAVFANDSFASREAQIYFWRVATIRSLRELALINSGKYDPPIRTYESQNGTLGTKEEIRAALISTLHASYSNLQRMME